MPTIKFQYSDDIRRVSVDNLPSLEDIKELVKKLFRQHSLPENIVLRYTDDEGDDCTVDSSMELEEAFRSATNGIVKFKIVDSKSNFNSFCQNLFTQTFQPHLRPKLKQKCKQKAAQAKSKNSHPPKIAQTPPFVVKPKINQPFRRAHTLHAKGVQLLASPDSYVEARNLIAEAVELLPNHTVFYYNLACAESLLNNKEQALAALKKSVALGYKNHKHMARDKDLDNIRNTEEFQELYKSIAPEEERKILVNEQEISEREGQEEKADEPEISEEQVENVDEPKEEEEVPLLQNVEAEEENPEADFEVIEREEDQNDLSGSVDDHWETLLKTLQEMGFHDTARNRELLFQYGGNMPEVVRALLN